MKLTIGTAQFGFKYGITNRKGKIDIKEINKVLMNKLDKAYEDRIVLRSQVLKSKVNTESEVQNA